MKKKKQKTIKKIVAPEKKSKGKIFYMTNFEKWQYYMKDITSPQSFIDAGFYYLISVALQRRVWMGNPMMDERSIFPNMYLLLVAPPGAGKGLCIKAICKTLQYLKRDDKTKVGKTGAGDTIDTTQMDELQKTIQQLKQVNADDRLKLLFPVAADCTTFESLVREHAGSSRTIIVTNAEQRRLSYMYASIYFSIEELGTLFREDQSTLMNYLLQTYDCGDFLYKTKNKGEDVVKNPSLSIIGGTTYAFVREAIMAKLIGEGFTSRAIMIAERFPRFHKFEFAELTAEQRAGWKDIVNHLNTLSKVYGQVKFSPEAKEYLSYYFEEEYPRLLPDIDISLLPYFSRKNIHIRKLCMCMLFGETTNNFVISLDIVKRGMNFLDSLEPKMLAAYQERSSNHRVDAMELVERILRKATVPVDYKNIYASVIKKVRSEDDLKEILKYFITTDQAKRLPNSSLYIWIKKTNE